MFREGYTDEKLSEAITYFFNLFDDEGIESTSPGKVIAHELGHYLLDTPEHKDDGGWLNFEGEDISTTSDNLNKMLLWQLDEIKKQTNPKE